MAEITASTTFTVQAATAVYSETAEIQFMPENDGESALRELHHPDGVLPVLVYEQNPDKWENFDSEPLTARPTLVSEQTLEGNVLRRWDGYIGDKTVREIWRGDDKRSPMTAYFFRRLYEYLVNPPTTGNHIEWYPKDRTDQGYYIEIENLLVGGQEVTLDFVALRGGYLTGEVSLGFRVIGAIE